RHRQTGTRRALRQGHPVTPPARSYLYVPGDDERKIWKALAGDADAVVIDLEDAVAPNRMEEARATAAAVQRARAQYPQLKVEVEADTLEQVQQAVAARADFVLLDNMSLAQLRQAVQECRGLAQTEASGGVNLASVRAIAETGVNLISVGALTHSARAVDIGLDFEL
ncbi:MAG TPA: aldolase/citrate lyase family protein, partial [Bacillota bacterium]|nr:aldolase/citrate lyase family protein [Bacillota bacterium]